MLGNGKFKLLEAADTALDKLKTMGRNRVEFFQVVLEFNI